MTIEYIDNFYPKEYVNVLTTLELEASTNGVVSGPKEKVFHRFAWWTFVDGIELHLPSESICIEFGIETKPTSFQSFLSDTCQGNIKKAIFIIDGMTKLTSFMLDIKKEFDLLKYLQQMGSFLRDIELIINLNKHRAERSVDIENTPVNQELRKEVNPLDPSGISGYGPYFEQFPNVGRLVWDSRPRGPSSPSSLSAGFCLVCHRLCSEQEFYCEAHTRSTGNESEIKRKTRMINNAFANLNMQLPFETTIKVEGLTASEVKRKKLEEQKKLNISNADAFHSRCYMLQGWAKQTEENKLFCSQLESICPQYFDIKKNENWSEESISIFNDIVAISKHHSHTEKIFHSSFYIRDTVSKLIQSLNLEVFSLNADDKYTPATAITMLICMNQFNLIELAARGKYHLLNVSSE